MKNVLAHCRMCDEFVRLETDEGDQKCPKCGFVSVVNPISIDDGEGGSVLGFVLGDPLDGS